MTTDPIGLYLHIPYCVRKCGYCDFCSLGGSMVVPEEYLSRLVGEAELYHGKGISVNTVFIGGGTPSLLSGAQLSSLVAELRRVFTFSSDTEFTIECNPGTTSPEFFRACRDSGVNRISFGLQSVHENELKSLGRIHTYSDFLAAFRDARAAGFDNISVDLMYGIPEQTIESFKETLNAVLYFSPEHVSSYGLIIEEGTRFFRKQDRLPIPDEDAECDMYYLAHEVLTSAGFSHYEVSNYSKPLKESRHNLKYWHRDDYIGLGASAHSCFNGKRYYNTSVVTDYIGNTGNALFNPEESDEESEYIMLRLRLSEGISLQGFSERFGRSFLEGREKLIEGYVAHGLARVSDEHFNLTHKGLYLSNSIIAELI